MKANQKARNNKAVSSVFATLLVLPILIAIISALFMLTANIIALTQIPQNVNEITVEQLTKSDIVKGLKEDQYFWKDTFQGNQIQWKVQGTATLTDEYYWKDGKSLEITTDAGETSGIEKPFPWRAYKQVEIQISFTIDQNEQYKNFSIRLGNHTNKGKITINTQNNNITYLNNTGENTIIDTNIALHKDPHCWHTIKLIIDFEKGEYHSVTLNEKTYDLRGVLLNNSKPKIGHEKIVIEYTNYATGLASSCVDNFIIRELSQMKGYTVTITEEETDYYSIRFNGTDDFLEVADDPTLDLTEEFTIEAWVKPDDVGTGPLFRCIVSKQDPGSGSDPYQFGLNNSQTSIVARTYDDDENHVFNFGSPVVLEDWNHLVITREYNSGMGMGQLRSYINGVLVESGGGPQNQDLKTTDGALRIAGSSSSIGDFFAGNIYELRIYGETLTESEITDHYNGDYSADYDTRAIWLFNEGEGTMAYDSSGNNNHAIFNNNPQWTTDIPNIP